MDKTVMRYQIADYLNVGTDTEKYALMGVGFNTLDENPSAQSGGSIYVNQKAQTNHIKNYQTEFPFDTDLVASEEAVMALYDVGRNQKTGVDAERDYVRVELFKPVTDTADTYEARRFRVAVAVSNINGAGGEAMKVTGALKCVGDFISGTFNVKTMVFTPTA